MLAADDEEAQMATKRRQVLPTNCVEHCKCLVLIALQDLDATVASVSACNCSLVYHRK